MVKTIIASDLEDSDLLLSLECASHCAKHAHGLSALQNSGPELAPRLVRMMAANRPELYIFAERI